MRGAYDQKASPGALPPLPKQQTPLTQISSCMATTPVAYERETAKCSPGAEPRFSMSSSDDSPPLHVETASDVSLIIQRGTLNSVEKDYLRGRVSSLGSDVMKLQEQVWSARQAVEQARTESADREEECQALNEYVDQLQQTLAEERRLQSIQAEELAQLRKEKQAVEEARDEVVSALSSELCAAKTQLAQCEAILDRLDLHPPFPDRLLRSASLRLRHIECTTPSSHD